MRQRALLSFFWLIFLNLKLQSFKTYIPQCPVQLCFYIERKVNKYQIYASVLLPHFHVSELLNQYLTLSLADILHIRMMILWNFIVLQAKFYWSLYPDDHPIRAKGFSISCITFWFRAFTEYFHFIRFSVYMNDWHRKYH